MHLSTMSGGVVNVRVAPKKTKTDAIDEAILCRASFDTCAKKHTSSISTAIDLVFEEIRRSATMQGSLGQLRGEVRVDIGSCLVFRA